MNTLSSDLRNKLERTCIAARKVAEKAARDALFALGVTKHRPPAHLDEKQGALHSKLRARAQALGDLTTYNATVESLPHLAHECAFEHWHRMLFARFLAENNLLIEPDMGVAVSLDEVKELAKDAKTNLWALAARFAQTMLPQIFRSDDPVLQVPLAREDQIKLEALLDTVTKDTFTASDSLGWCYQFWQTERKEEVNKAGNKIGADELPSVTQLFTEDYMVDFLLDNTLGAWHAGKVLAANPKLGEKAKSEDELRQAVALPGCPWKYLRFIKGKDGKWTPAAGTFDGWPKTAAALRALDPCMGSGHFVVAMFERLVALRLAEENLDAASAVAAVIRDNLFGLEIDPRCTQIAAFNLALAAWRRVGHCKLPAMNLACSGLAPNTREAEWLAIAGDNQKLQRGMERLYRLFQKAAVLGSLINPRAGEGDLLVAAFHELQPLLEKALAQETKDDTAHEMAVTARGLAKAAEILAGQFTLVATNVPYLGFQKQDEVLVDYCERVHPNAKADLSTCFVERCLSFASIGCTSALVTPQNWLFLGRYRKLREELLEHDRWSFALRLGPGAFETIGGEVVKASLLALTRIKPSAEALFAAMDVASEGDPQAKARALLSKPVLMLPQQESLDSPDSTVSLDRRSELELLAEYADSHTGAHTLDIQRFRLVFWELHHIGVDWNLHLSTPAGKADFSGMEYISFTRKEGKAFAELAMKMKEEGFLGGWLSGNKVWGKRGVACSWMGNLPASLYPGPVFDNSVAVILPKKMEHLPAIWCFCSSPQYVVEVRKINQKMQVASATLVKVPFDLAHWQKVAAEKYPHGLPKPFSSDPTQWLFNGHPAGADQPLHVAVARLLGYQWPRQTGSSFPDCPALGPDGLEKLADDDGIVCLPSVRGESPAADRLRKLLAAAFGKDWKAHTELELIRASGSDAADLDEWLRNDFFEQHCDLFHQRPFLWHIWDGRKRDGFHALVNYHVLAAEKGKGRRTLESLAHSYLGDWITRQKDGEKRGEEGAEERLAAALALKERLEAIVEGEPPFDVFVRWKPLSQQAMGWKVDINDGVRMNIRPFLASDIPGGKKGAGILRAKPNIKWDKDRGKEPHREKKEFPWFWDGKEFTGDRVNEVHLTKQQKEKAKE